MNLVHSIAAKLRGKNSQHTPTAVIKDQMHELRPLPIGIPQFLEWSDRIIAGAMVEANHDDQRYALANEILHLKPTEDHKDDAYWIHILRKLAVNQTADGWRQAYFKEKKARLAAEETAQPPSEAN